MATTQPNVTESAAASAEPIDYLARVREIATAEAKGEPIDKAELREVLYELNWSKPKYNNFATMVRNRYNGPAAIAQHRELLGHRERLESERAAIAEQVKAATEQRRAELELLAKAELAKCREPLNAFDAENAERLEKLKSLPHETPWIKYMQQTSDPRISWKIAQLNQELLALDNQRQWATDRRPDVKRHDETEWTGTGPRLVSRTFMDAEYWKGVLSMSKATLDDETAAKRDKERAQRGYNEAATWLAGHEHYEKEMLRIYHEEWDVRDRIKQLQEQFYVPENFAVE